MGPPSSGAITINQILGIVERYNLSKTEATDSFNDWQRINLNQIIKIDTSKIIVSIFIL